MFSGKIDSYKGYINSKRIYLKRKKELIRELKKVKRKEKLSKGFKRNYYKRIIEKGTDDLYLLNIMYNYHKRENTIKIKKQFYKNI